MTREAMELQIREALFHYCNNLNKTHELTENAVRLLSAAFLSGMTISLDFLQRTDGDVTPSFMAESARKVGESLGFQMGGLKG